MSEVNTDESMCIILKCEKKELTRHLASRQGANIKSTGTS